MIGKSAQQTGRKVNAIAQQAGNTSRQISTHAQQMQRAFSGVAAAAVAMGGRVHSGAASGAQGVAVMTRQVQRLDRAMQGAKNSAAKFQNVHDALGQVRGASVGMMGTSAVGVAVSGKGALDAGEYNRSRNAIRGALGESAGDQFLEEVQKSQYARVFGMKQAIQTAQTQVVVGGFSPEELINKQRTGLMQTVGSMAAAGGAKSEGVTEALRQIGQIKRKTQAEKSDLDVIAESGGIDIYGLISSKFGNERTKEVLKGEKPLTYKELEQALSSIPEYKGGQFKNTLGDAANQLPGQIEALRGSLFLLSQSLGQHVLPAASMAVTSVTTLADWLRNLPGPLKFCVAWGGVLAVGLTGLGGALLGGAALCGQAAIGLMALNGQLALTGPLAGKAGIGLIGLARGALPALGASALATAGTIAAAIAVLAFAAYVAKKYYDEMQKPTETVRDGRTGEEAAQDSSTAQKIRDSVAAAKADPNINTRGKIAVLAEASKKMGDAGFTDEAIALAEERAKLARTAPQGEAKGAEKYLSQIRSMNGFFRISMQSSAGPKIKGPEDEIKTKADELEKKANAMMAQQPATMPGAFGAQSVSGMETGANGVAVMSGGDSIESLELRQLNGEDVTEQLKRARHNEKWGNKRATASRKAQKEAEKNQNSEAIEAGIAALGDGRADVGKIREMQRQLSAANRKKNTVEATILRERIARAQDALEDIRKGESEQKKQGRAAIQRLRTNARRQSLGMPTVGGEMAPGIDGGASSGTSSGASDSRLSIGALTSYLRRGGSLSRIKDGKLPGVVDFGAGSAVAGADGRPQNGGIGSGSGSDDILTVTAKTQLIPHGAARKILKIIVPDVVIEDSFTHAVNGVRR